eukprot:2502028-Rhodomonas_salina.2
MPGAAKVPAALKQAGIEHPNAADGSTCAQRLAARVSPAALRTTVQHASLLAIAFKALLSAPTGALRA